MGGLAAQRHRSQAELRAGAVALIAGLSASGCLAPRFDPPSAELFDVLARHEPPPEVERLLATAEIESERLGGVFRAALVRRAGTRPAARLQLLPELGGKVLDLAVRADGFAAYMPHAGIGLQAEFGHEAPPRHLLSFLAVSVLEGGRTIAFERVAGARRTAHGWELALRQRVPGVAVEATVTLNGELLERRYKLRGVGWRERFDPHRFESRGFRLTLVDETSEELAGAPDALFELELPAGIAP